MGTIHSQKETSFFNSFLYGGAAHGLEVVAGGHILDRIKVHCEARGQSSSIQKNIRDIFSSGGWPSLYKGFRWNIALSVFKGSNGWAINNFANRIVSQLRIKDESLAFPLTVSLITALVESTLIIAPLERIKVIEMTSFEKKIPPVFQVLKKEGLSFFFVGWLSVVFRQSVTWTSYLCFYHFYKQKLDVFRTRSFSRLFDNIMLGGLTGASVCFLNSPIDFYKTHKQMFHSLPYKEFNKNIKHLINKYGVHAFYSNLKIKILRSSFSCIVVISVLDYLDGLPRNMKIKTY